MVKCSTNGCGVAQPLSGSGMLTQTQVLQELNILLWPVVEAVETPTPVVGGLADIGPQLTENLLVVELALKLPKLFL